MSVEKRTDIAVRATLIVLLATLFHLFLFTVVDAPGELFGARAQLPVAALALVAGYVVFVCLFSVIPLWRGKSPSSFVRAVTALLALPLYLFMFPLNGPMSIVGMLWCVLQSHCLLSEAGGVKHARHVSRASTRLVLLSSYGILVIVFLVSGQNIVGGMAGVTASYLFVAVAIAVSLFVEHRRFSLREGPYVEHVLLLVALACGFTPLGRWTLPLLAARQLIVAARSWHHEFGIEEIWRYLTERPAQLLVLSFALVIALGTVVLCLPQATTGPGRLGILEALFTATSATCVTGLVVVETGRAFTMFGQCVILTMIQIGGLGIMTISVFVAQALGRRMGLRGEFAFGEMIGEERNRMAARLLMFIVLVTMAVELCGGCALAWGFHHYSGEAWGRSVYLGVFHSVSAFCNAGFALYGDSFEGFSRQPFFPITLSLLILLGGVGFGVLYTLFRLPGSRRRGPNPHVTIVLWMTVVLCVGGTVALWILERGNSLANMSLIDSLVNAWFQSVTARTAGFNTVDLTQFSPASNVVMTILMFIGGAPGSTAGGVKVTTVAVFVLLIVSALHGRKNVVVCGRTIELETVFKASALVALSMLVVATAIVLLLHTQHALGPGNVIFEAVSAFGTVGLSLKATSGLNSVGRGLIILLMFLGRVGPLTLLVMVRPRRKSSLEYPSAKVMIG